MLNTNVQDAWDTDGDVVADTVWIVISFAVMAAMSLEETGMIANNIGMADETA